MKLTNSGEKVNPRTRIEIEQINAKLEELDKKLQKLESEVHWYDR